MLHYNTIQYTTIKYNAVHVHLFIYVDLVLSKTFCPSQSSDCTSEAKPIKKMLSSHPPIPPD